MANPEYKNYQTPGFDDSAAPSHMHVPPPGQPPAYPGPSYPDPSYQGPPPPNYGIHPVVLQPQYAGTTFQQTTVLPGPSSVTYVTQQPGVVTGGVATVYVSNSMGTSPTPMNCRSCGVQMVTRVESRPTCTTHVMALLLCLFLCWPCVCVPYCIDSCMAAEHYCPNCNAYVGSSL